MKEIYLLFVSTPSLISRAIKSYTNDPYTHVAISVDPCGQEFYSFARRYSYSPLPAGFVKESLSSGFYRRNPETKCRITAIEVTEEQYTSIKERLEYMYENRYDYKYNLLGLLLFTMNVSIERKNHRFCSEFVSEVLKENNLLSTLKLPQEIRPMELIDMDKAINVYEGMAMNYRYSMPEYGRTSVAYHA